jgi:hypothetical protein
MHGQKIEKLALCWSDGGRRIYIDEESFHFYQFSTTSILLQINNRDSSKIIEIRTATRGVSHSRACSGCHDHDMVIKIKPLVILIVTPRGNCPPHAACAAYQWRRD